MSHISHVRRTELRALLVEDEPVVRETVSAHLAALGCRVWAAASGPEALSLLDIGFDLLVTDVLLPGGIHGVQLARQACTVVPGLKVLLVSGCPTEALPQYEAGEWVFLPKPFRRGQLEEALRQALQDRHRSPEEPGVAGVLSTSAGKYGLMADECRELAARAQSDEARREWLRLEKEWLSLENRAASKVGA